MALVRVVAPLIVGVAFLEGCASAPMPAVTPQNVASLREQVLATERGFAKTMADRNFVAFQSYLSEETIFWTGATPLRGKAAAAANWKRFYEEKEALRWEPAGAEVLDSNARAELGAGARPRRQAVRQLHVGVASGSAGRLAHRSRQGLPSLRLRGHRPPEHPLRAPEPSGLASAAID
jgi:hypothetical protein